MSYTLNKCYNNIRYLFDIYKKKKERGLKKNESIFKNE